MRRTVTLILTLGLLAGCGATPDDDAPEVATLASAPAGASSAPAPPATERPLIRTDTSPEEEQRLWDDYQRCLEANGYDKPRAPAGVPADDAPRPALPDPARDAREAKAAEACQHKEPEQVWERAKRTDPAYADKLHAWVMCVRAQGIDAWENDGFLAFKSLPPENEMKKVHECQDKAFGKG